MELPTLPEELRRGGLGQFFIDLTEVTNRAYKEFVDVGGYSREEFWREEFKRDGQVISWVEAMRAFTDRTGRPGPFRPRTERSLFTPTTSRSPAARAAAR